MSETKQEVFESLLEMLLLESVFREGKIYEIDGWLGKWRERYEKAETFDSNYHNDMEISKTRFHIQSMEFICVQEGH